MIKREHRPVLIGAVIILILALAVVLLPQNRMHFLDYKAKIPYPPRPNWDDSLGSRGGQPPATVPYDPSAQGEETESTASSTASDPAKSAEASSLPTSCQEASSLAASSMATTKSTENPEPSSFQVLVPSLPVPLPSLPSLPSHQPDVNRVLVPLTKEESELRSIYETYRNVVVSVRLLQPSTGRRYPLDTSFSACCIAPGLYLSNWSNLQNYGDHFGNLYTGNALAVMAGNSSSLAPVKIRAYDVFTDLVVLELTQAYRDQHDPSTWPAQPLTWNPELIPLIVKLWPPALLFGEAATGDEDPSWLQANLPLVELRNALLGSNMSDYVGSPVYVLGAPASYQDSEQFRALTITASHAPLMSEDGDLMQLFDCEPNIPASMVGALVLDSKGQFFGILNNNQAFQPRLPGNSILSAFTCYQGLAKLGFGFGMDPVNPPQEGLVASEKLSAKKGEDSSKGRAKEDASAAPLAPTDPHSYWTSLGIYFYDDLSLLQYQRTFDSSRGALIKAVKMDSQASRAGFQAGDLLLRIGGKDVRTGKDAVALLKDYGPGKEILCEVMRGPGQRLDLRVYPDFGLAGSLQ